MISQQLEARSPPPDDMKTVQQLPPLLLPLAPSRSHVPSARHRPDLMDSTDCGFPADARARRPDSDVVVLRAAPEPPGTPRRRRRLRRVDDRVTRRARRVRVPCVRSEQPFHTSRRAHAHVRREARIADMWDAGAPSARRSSSICMIFAGFW